MIRPMRYPLTTTKIWAQWSDQWHIPWQLLRLDHNDPTNEISPDNCKDLSTYVIWHTHDSYIILSTLIPWQLDDLSWPGPYKRSVGIPVKPKLDLEVVLYSRLYKRSALYLSIIGTFNPPSPSPYKMRIETLILRTAAGVGTSWVKHSVSPTGRNLSYIR